MCESKPLGQILAEAETSSCDELLELQDALVALCLNPVRAAAAMQNILTLHVTGGFCDQPDGHTRSREIFSPPEE